MVRLAIIGVILAAAFIIYALVDAAMSDPRRVRGVSKPVWVVFIVVLPVIGAVLWFVIGRGNIVQTASPAGAPDIESRPLGMSDSEIDAHVEELEARLRELDAEVFPGVDTPEEAPSDQSEPPEQETADDEHPDTDSDPKRPSQP